MMKRLLFVFMVFLILVSPLTVLADAIIEPDNQFYKQYSNKCVYLKRDFCGNGTDGYISVKNDPRTKNEICQIKNNEIIYIEYSCLYDGEYWGLTTYVGEPGSGKGGWIKMEQLLVIYDYVSFEEEHFNEFYQYTGDFSEIKEAGAAIAWSWPGSGSTLRTISNLDTESVHISHAFKDEQGREWGFIPYLYASRNLWICISDPVNHDIPAFNPVPEPVKWETQTEHIEIEKDDNPMIILIIILVTALVAGTAILIKIFWKPQRENKQIGEDNQS